MLNRSGIYKITCTANGRFYIGSAVNFKARWAIHTHGISKGTHHSRHLQRAWSKYGEEAFKFEVLMVCEKADLLMYEQRAIDVLKPEFNMSPTAGSTLGMKHTAEQRKANSERCKARCNTPEEKARMSAQMVKRFSTAESRADHAAKIRVRLAATPKEVLQAKYTPEVKKKLSEATKSRAQTYNIRGELLAARDIAVKYGVNRVQFRARMRRGWDMERAATTPPEPKHTKQGARVYEYKGKLCSLKDLEAVAQCTKSSLYRRIKSGLSVAQAVEMTPEQAEARRLQSMRCGHE